jgi:hypothetical protein
MSAIISHDGWRKSSHSGQAGQCVEFRPTGDLVQVRNSRDPQGARLTFDRAALGEFLAAAKNGELDDLA